MPELDFEKGASATASLVNPRGGLQRASLVYDSSTSASWDPMATERLTYLWAAEQVMQLFEHLLTDKDTLFED